MTEYRWLGILIGGFAAALIEATLNYRQFLDHALLVVATLGAIVVIAGADYYFSRPKLPKL